SVRSGSSAARARSVCRATLAEETGTGQRGTRRPSGPERQCGAQSLFERGAFERHRVIRDPAGIVRAAAQAAQGRDQIVRFFPTGFPVRRFPFSGFSFGSPSFGGLSFGGLSFGGQPFSRLSLDPGDLRGMALQGGIQTRDPRLLALPRHEPGPERVLRCVLIVSAAPEAQAIDGGNAAARKGLDMIELEEAAGRAPMSVRAHERAPPSVALPYRAPDLGRDISGPCATRPNSTDGRPGRLAAINRDPGGAKLPLLEPVDQGIKRAIEQLRHVAGRNGMAEQGLGMTKLVVGDAVDGDPHEVALGSSMPWGMFTAAEIPITMPWGMFTAAEIPITMPWGMLVELAVRTNMPRGMFIAVELQINMPWGMFVEQARFRDSGQTDPGAHGLDDRSIHRRSKRWESARQQRLDLRLAPMGRGLDQLVRVVRRDARGQEPHGGKMQPAFRERVEERGNAAGGPGRMDALRGGVFGESKTIDAIGEHGRAAFRNVRAPGIGFGDVGQEHRRQFSVSSRPYRQST
ncbi:MAG TPA: hypothetical protein VFT93_04400, partial [Candidatus Eisenbacteria bacterium]|nr:hypothetical protein [Candidatus Eisenbacteria bacterium]